MFEASIFMGRRRFQPVWEKLHSLSLRGMNVGTGAFVDASGELAVLDRVAARLLRDGPGVVFDVGANTGDYSVQASARLGGRNTVYAFEPSRAAFARLSERLGGRENVRLLNYGLSDSEKVVPLYADAEGSPLASTYPRRLEYLGIEMAPLEQVTLRTLDSVCEEEGVRHLALLKLDVEGNELNVLRGARKMIDAGAIDHIQFEFGGTNIDSRTYLRDFFELLGGRYSLFRILVDDLAPMPTYRETYEIFDTTNYLAVAKSI